ncbi:hypothetical protein AAMO2058_001045300 [Amorphochlora amoebiformis]|mmetsp:Transcript_5355/g.8130  ORF Transcript_5355/g.8130 Transcript_5355/m.8130 type:complete len:528 (-) Transcript_5355:90-1673(-)
MVVLAAAVTNKTGKVLLSRQFMEMKRIRIEGLLAGFTKLVGKGKKEHSLIETDEVRYVYQPLEGLYVLIITNPQSNIMEDLDTLRLLSKLIPQYCEGTSEADVAGHTFELIFAFDEVVNNGFKEYVTLQQVKTYTTMDSHEERIQNIILHSKMSEAKEEARSKAKAIEIRKRDRMKFGVHGDDLNAIGGGGMGSDGPGGEHQTIGRPPARQTPEFSPSEPEESRDVRRGPGENVGLGMQLDAGANADDFLRDLGIKEDKVPRRNPFAVKKEVRQEEELKDGVMLLVDVSENLNVSMGSDGTVKKMEVKGGVKITCYSPDVSRVIVQTNGPLKKPFLSRMQPRLDKKKWSKGALCSKDTSKPFPTGSADALTLVTWKLSSTKEDLVPFTVNCWPNHEGSSSIVSVEFEIMNPEIVCKNVVITIPCPGSKAPKIISADGKADYISREKALAWQIDEISEDNSSGALEFTVPKLESSAFFPIEVNFSSPTLYSKMKVKGVLTAQDGKPVQYKLKSALSTSKYTIIEDVDE